MTEQRQRESTRIKQLRERQAQKDRIRTLQHNQNPEFDNRYLFPHTAPQFNTNLVIEDHQEKQPRNPHITNKSNWSKKQRIRYLVFLKFYSELTFFGSDLKSIPTFKHMSQFVKTRSPQQSKSFHLSNKRLFNNQEELIQALTDDLQYEQGFQKLLDRYENQIIQFDQQCNFLSDHFLQMNSYFRKKLNKSENQDENQEKNKSYDSKINIKNLMKEKSASDLQERYRFNNERKLSKGSFMKQHQASSQQAPLNSYNSSERFMERPMEFNRNRYDMPNSFEIPSQQLNYFNPYGLYQMNKAQINNANQMNRFQIQQMAKTQKMIQQNEYQKRMQSIQQQRKMNAEKIKNIIGTQSNNPYLYQPGINTPYSPYLDNRYIQNRNSNLNMPFSIHPNIPPFPSNIPSMPSNFMPNLNFNGNINNLQIPKLNNIQRNQKISPQKINVNSFSRQVKPSQNLIKQNQNNTNQNLMSDQRKKLIQNCHEHWTKWLKGVLQLKNRRQKERQRNQSKQINIKQ